MSSLTNQTAINGLKDFFARSHKNISSLSQVVPNPLPYNESFNIETQPAGGNLADIKGFANALFIQNPTATYFTLPGQGQANVAIGHSATQQNNIPALYVSSSQTQLDGKLILANTNPNEGTAILMGTVNPAGQQTGYYQLYNGNTDGGGLQASTIQLFSYFGGGIAQNIQFLPDGTTYIPNQTAATATVSNLLVSTINGATPNPTPGSGQQFSNITYNPTANGFAATTQSFPAPINSICEGFASGNITWSNTPVAGDYFEIFFYSGAQFSDQIGTHIPIGLLSGAAGNIPFSFGGYFQTTNTPGTVDISVRTSVGTPSNYGITIANGNFRVIGPQ